MRPFPKGVSGNPGGKGSAYHEALRLARAAAPEAMRRLIELMQDQDGRVAAVACQAVLDRALGKVPSEPPRGMDEPALLFDFNRLSLDQLRFLKQLCEQGLIEVAPDQAAEPAPAEETT